jgi:iron(III) transport system ATP-binding protein
MSSLTVSSLSKDFGPTRVVSDLNLDVPEGEMLVLVGPSGCGKTTTLRCIAGLERPSAGRIAIGERVVTAIEEGVFVPPEKRRIGMVFQSYAVWPHMTVFNNVAYPLRASGVARSDIRGRVAKALQLVQLEALAERYSSQLSGGQQQRVALARSLVHEPRLLLFDEPLSNLDANLRLQMRIEIKELQKRLGFTSVYVTHDQSEAMAIADRIAVMDRGVVAQIGTSRDIYERPANTFVAGFMGTTNLVKGTVNPGIDGHAVFRSTGGLEIRIAQPNSMRVAADANVCIRPEALHLGATCSGVNAWPATVTLSTFLGNAIVYRLDVSGHAFEAHAKPDENFQVGSNVIVSADPASCTLLFS